LTVIFSGMLYTFQIYAQQKGNNIALLKGEMETFKYNKVITDADSILRFNSNLSSKDLVDINMMKGIAQFSLSDNNGAKKSFINILKIDTTFEFNPADTSPKIIGFFDQVKNEYMQIFHGQKQYIKVDTVFIPKLVEDEKAAEDIKEALIRSVIIPGLGHLYLNEYLKGGVLTAISALTIGSSIYFIIDSNKKENQYLNATDPAVMQSAYNKFNTSYKMKNISLISFATVWLYSQIDILFFTGKGIINNSNIQLHSEGNKLSLKFFF